MSRTFVPLAIGDELQKIQPNAEASSCRRLVWRL